MIHVVLYQPEIPPNTGNIARTCAATGIALHLIEPLGFSISDKHVRRAGLDYWNSLDIRIHSSWDAFLRCTTPLATTVNQNRDGSSDGETHLRLALFSTRGVRLYTEIDAVADERNELYLVFGPETRGLPTEILSDRPESVYRVPMRPELRSLNLSNTVALVVYEILRARGFPGLS